MISTSDGEQFESLFEMHAQSLDPIIKGMGNLEDLPISMMAEGMLSRRRVTPAETVKDIHDTQERRSVPEMLGPAERPAIPGEPVVDPMLGPIQGRDVRISMMDEETRKGKSSVVPFVPKTGEGGGGVSKGPAEVVKLPIKEKPYDPEFRSSNIAERKTNIERGIKEGKLTEEGQIITTPYEEAVLQRSFDKLIKSQELSPSEQAAIRWDWGKGFLARMNNKKALENAARGRGTIDDMDVLPLKPKE